MEVEGVLRASLRDQLEVAGFVPTPSKLYRPSRGLVARSALVEQVRTRRPDVVTVTAPAGYGKSTFLAELTDDDPRPTGWLSLTAAENDPATLLRYIALALDEIEPVDPRHVRARYGRSLGSPAMAQFGAMLADRRLPFVLVLDDVHELVSRDVLDTLPGLVGELPAGSSILFGSRTAVPLPLGRLRVRRRVVEVDLADLAFDEADAAALFRSLDIEASATETARLVARTEGWPVALYLAALTGGTHGKSLVDVAADFGGDQRYIVEYFGEELLGGLDSEMVSFLMEASCFERFSGQLCDEVLDRHGSADLLEDLRRRNLLVIPLDDRREWYRFHHLLTEFLQTELSRRDPARRAAIHVRASEWCDAHDDGDGAVTHAARGSDLARMESMVTRWFGPVGGGGQLYPTTAHWIELVSDAELGASPTLMLAAAWIRFGAGQPGPALDFVARATESLRPDLHPGGVRGPVPPVALALTTAVIAPLPASEMAAEAMYAYEHLGRGTGYPMSCLARGAAHFMLGDEPAAVHLLGEGAANTLGYVVPAAMCLAHLAVIHVEHGRWAEAAEAVEQARGLLGDVAGAPYNVLTLAMSVLVDTHAGRVEVETERMLCRQHLTGFVGVAPWLNLQARVALARVAVMRGDRVDAVTLIEEAAAILAATPGAVTVERQLAGLRREAAARDRWSPPFGPSSLTTAERRVLQYLPTHLSIAEIAVRLYVSRNTVKSQTISIYRKLGATSRTAAVAIATAAGLLHDTGVA